MVKARPILLAYAFVIFASSVPEVYSPFYDNILSLPSEIREHCFYWLSAYHNLSLSRTCKAFRKFPIEIIKSRAEESIKELVPLWFASERGSNEKENLKSLLTYLLSCLTAGEPEDFLLDIIKVELFANDSEDYLVACDRYPEIVNEIIKGRKSLDNISIPTSWLINYLDPDFWSGFDSSVVENLDELLFEHILSKKYDIVKLCDFLDCNSHLLTAEFDMRENIMPLLDLFSARKDLPLPSLDDEILYFAILLLRYNQEERKRLLKTLSGQSGIDLANERDVEDTIIDYCMTIQNQASYVIQCISLFATIKISDRFLLKLLEKFKVKDRLDLVFALQMNDYPLKLYEVLSRTSTSQIMALLKSAPSTLSASQIEAAIILLPDLEMLFDTISSLRSAAEFTRFHLFLLLASKNFSQELKVKFASLPLKLSILPSMLFLINFNLGPEFVEPLMKAITNNPTEELLNFCSFPEFSLVNLCLLRQYKLFALKLRVMLLLGRDEMAEMGQDNMAEIGQPMTPMVFSALTYLTMHLLRQYQSSEIKSFMRKNRESFNGLLPGEGFIVFVLKNNFNHLMDEEDFVANESDNEEFEKENIVPYQEVEEQNTSSDFRDKVILFGGLVILAGAVAAFIKIRFY